MTYLVEPPSWQVGALPELPLPVQLPGADFGLQALVVDDWVRLERFLVTGREDGSYRAGNPGLLLESAHSVFRCLVADGPRVVRTIVKVSEAGRPSRPEAVLFVLALAASDRAARETRSEALVALPWVCRTGADLLHFARYVDDLRGWGRGLRRAIAEWYRQPAERIAHEVAATPEQEGWTHRDLLRLAHPKAPSPAHQELFRWIVRGWDELPAFELPELQPIYGRERARRATNRHDVVAAIRDYGLAPQAVPSEWLEDAEVRSGLVEAMSTTDLIRNLTARAGGGFLTGASGITKVAAHLSDVGRVCRSRIHPIEVLAAWKAYAQGEIGVGCVRTPDPAIERALETAFHHALRNVAPTGKRWLIALDVSGSTSVGEIAGMPGLSPREAAAAMAIVGEAAERRPTLVGFTAGPGGPGGRWGGAPQLTPLHLRPGVRLADAVGHIRRLPMGGVDCAFPMQWALQQKLPIDVFAVYTDSETWSGRVSPLEALRQYRNRMGIPAKLVVVGLGSSGFRVADPNDGGMLDVIGFDTSAPGVIADFAGR